MYCTCFGCWQLAGSETVAGNSDGGVTGNLSAFATHLTAQTQRSGAHSIQTPYGSWVCLRLEEFVLHHHINFKSLMCKSKEVDQSVSN